MRPPKSFVEDMPGPYWPAMLPAHTVLWSRGSRIAWRIGKPSMKGPRVFHFLRSFEWRMKSPFLVPAITTVSPFLTSAMATTCHVREDVHLVAVAQRYRAGVQVR